MKLPSLTTVERLFLVLSFGSCFFFPQAWPGLCENTAHQTNATLVPRGCDSYASKPGNPAFRTFKHEEPTRGSIKNNGTIGKNDAYNISVGSQSQLLKRRNCSF